MLLSILLVAEVAVATPAPTPVPTRSTSSPGIQTGSTDLSSVAGKVKLDRAKADAVFKEVGNSVAAPSAPLPVLTVFQPARKGLAESSREETRWHERAARLQQVLANAQAELQRAEQSFPDAAYGTITSERRAARLRPFRERVARAQAAFDGLPEECRKAGCQPGWIR